MSLSFEDLRKFRRAAEDAISACNPDYGPFVRTVSHPLNILALVEMAEESIRLKQELASVKRDSQGL